MAIASCLVDTNILLRMTRRSDPQHQLVDAALARLASQGTTLHYTHQNIAELWNAMTRPQSRNGLGLAVAEAEREVAEFRNYQQLSQQFVEINTQICRSRPIEEASPSSQEKKRPKRSNARLPAK